MLARFDHRPMLTALLALSTAVLFVVVITLTTLLIITAAPQAASPTSVNVVGNSIPGGGDTQHTVVEGGRVVPLVLRANVGK